MTSNGGKTLVNGQAPQQPSPQPRPTPNLSPADVAAILELELVRSHYQPVVSMMAQAVIGYEALARASHPVTGQPVPPPELFRAARACGRLLELDRLCRRKALEGFRALPWRRRDQVVSINFEAALLDQGVAGSNHLLRAVEAAGLDPATVAIEIIESKVRDMDSLQRFVETYRAHGFVLALDDVGSGHSNLERIALLKPDVIKIDRSLVQDLDRHFYKQQVVRALVALGHSIGALVLAEGVERQEEAIAALDMGVNLLQGYLLGRPSEDGGAANGASHDAISELAACLRQRAMANAVRSKEWGRRLEQVESSLLAMVSGVDPTAIERRLREMIRAHPWLECVYVLDENGRQVSETICAPHKINYRGQVLYRPAPKGADQSLKRYYLLLGAGLERYVSTPYISMASGNRCVTVSSWFHAADGRRLILCADFDAQTLE